MTPRAAPPLVSAMLLLLGAALWPEAAGAQPVVVTHDPKMVDAPADDQPIVNHQGFSWEIVHWTFRDAGDWLLDDSGHRLSMKLPWAGFTRDFYGPQWDGTQIPFTIDDPQLAVKGPFTLNVVFGREDVAESDRLATAHLMTRGDPEGVFAFDLMLHGDTVSFTIADEAGHRSTVEGKADLSKVSVSYFAAFDPRTGDQWLYKFPDCSPQAHTVTKVRPAQKLADPRLRMLAGYRGHVFDLIIDRGLYRPHEQKSEGNCIYRGEQLNRRAPPER